MLVVRGALSFVARTDGDHDRQSTKEVDPEQVPDDGPDDSLAVAERGESSVSTETTEGPRPAGSIVDGGALTEPNLVFHELVSRNVFDRNDAFFHPWGIIVTTTGGESPNHTEPSSEVTPSSPITPSSLVTPNSPVTPAGSSRGSTTSAASELVPEGIAFGEPLALAGVGLWVDMTVERRPIQDFFRDLDDTLDE
ncbi:Single-strand telomeric DNA-binding protein GBP2 [Verticillium dahliae VDG1]|nr:Single-strand telomeric DNA-binding protein GBP2 [Verticillium dahliae VDG1]